MANRAMFINLVLNTCEALQGDSTYEMDDLDIQHLNM